ncbi:MAG: hypothetical protein ABIR27_01740 [Dokdonella sp.]
MSFFTELKRRNVIRMGGLYLVGAWLILQVADTLLPVFEAPGWVMKVLVAVLAIGFVPALAVAWIFELTPTGLKRDEDVVPQESIAPRTAQRMNRTIMIGLVVALGYFVIDKFVFTSQRGVSPSASVSASDAKTTSPSSIAKDAIDAVAKSIAVLPFDNLSDDKANAYFTIGMQDEILTRLAGIRDLKVISRTSTEQYASHPPNLRVVAEQLGVASVLEGSVQRANGKVRINLQLIDASNDSHLWAKNYDRDVADVFAVQSDVAEQVATALSAQLLPAETVRLASVPTTSSEAHELLLQARYLFNQLQTSTANDPAVAAARAVDLYHRAIATDPEFALAHAQLSYLLSYLHWYAVDTRPAVVTESLDAAKRALQLQRDLPEAHLAMGYVHYWGHRDYEPALKEFAIARDGMPNSAEALAAIAYVHRRQGLFEQSITELQQAILLDPRNLLLPREIAASHVALRRYGEAEIAFAHALEVSPGDVEAQVQRATNQILSGDVERAERLLQAIPEGTDPQGTVSLLRFKLHMLLRDPDAALASIVNSPEWLLARFEHSAAPIALLRGQALAMKGEAAAARVQFLNAQHALQEPLKNPVTEADAQSFLGLVEAGLGERQSALEAGRKAVEELSMARDALVGGYTLERLVRVEAQVGETDSAIDHLRQLMNSPAGQAISVATLRKDPVWDPLRKDPRFQALLKSAEPKASTHANE